MKKIFSREFSRAKLGTIISAFLTRFIHYVIMYEKWLFYNNEKKFSEKKSAFNYFNYIYVFSFAFCFFVHTFSLAQLFSGPEIIYVLPLTFLDG